MATIARTKILALRRTTLTAMAQRPSVNPFKLLLRSLPKPIRNKYILTSLLFFAILLFFGKHNFLTQWKLHNSVNNLETDKVYYQEKIDELNEDKAHIEANKEQVAREEYHLHKSDEEVFVIPEEED